MSGLSSFGRVLDAQTNAPVTGALIYEVGRPDNNDIADENGDWSLTLGNSSIPVGIHADGYGEAVGSLYGISGDYYIYKTTAPAIVKARAVLINNFFGFIITVAAILLFIHLAKKI